MLFDVKNCIIKIGRKTNPNSLLITSDFLKREKGIAFKKYSIKESDFRTKTATVVTSDNIDLTTGVYVISISSIYHENFTGYILKKDYDEGSGLYTYTCQDFSRNYQSKMEAVFNGDVKVYNILIYCLTKGKLPFNRNPTSTEKKNWKPLLNGLKSIGLYDQSLYKGNIVNGNPMTDKPNLIIRDKSFMEVMRELTFGKLQFVDLWFNDVGALNITPLSKSDWETTGLVLSANTDRSFTFDITNAITGVVVTGDGLNTGNSYAGSSLINLNLSAFFGGVTANISGNTNSSVSSKSTNTSNITTSNNNNPFNKKKKKVWINADTGSNSWKNSLASALKKAGWNVHVGSTDSNAHYRDYWNVTKDYSVYITLYNGFCAGTIREAYSSKIQNVLKKKGVQLVPIWHTNDWTNPKGMKPYRYGDFSKYSAKRAWDDNFSSSNPAIKNVGDFFKKNKATYCASPSVSEIMSQFNAGGYFAYKGIKV